MDTKPWLSPDLNAIASLGAVDLIIAVVVIGSMISALRRRAGVLGALGSGLAATLVCWLAVAALVVWSPPEIRRQVSGSAFAQQVPLPTGAMTELGRWIGETTGSLAGPPPPPKTTKG